MFAATRQVITNGLRPVQNTQFQKQGCFEGFNNWTSLMAVACGSILAAGSLIIVAQHKSPNLGLISPSFLLPLVFSCQKLPRGCEIKALPVKQRFKANCDAVFACHIRTVPAFIMEDQGRCLLALAKRIWRISVILT